MSARCLCWIVNCVRYALLVLLLAPCCSILQDKVAFPWRWVRSVGEVEGKGHFWECSHSQHIFYSDHQVFVSSFLFVLSLIKQNLTNTKFYLLFSFLSKYMKYDDDNQYECRAEVRWNLSRSISLLAASFFSFVLLRNIPDPWLLAQQNSLVWAFCLLCWVSSTWRVLLAHRGLQQALQLGQSQPWKVVKKMWNPAEIKIASFTEQMRNYRQNMLWHLISKIFGLKNCLS